MKIGFVPLLDAAPLIAAVELGFFRDERLEVSLQRQVGWANIRDKLSFGHIDVGHALLGMPLTSHLGRDSFSEPLTTLMELGAGGNAITIRKGLHEMGVQSAADLASLIAHQPRMGRLMVGHVFSSSMHHYLVREWLSSGGIDPDRDVKLCVIPPPQVTEHMKGGYLDVFCVGEPWNTLATREGHGMAVVATTDILPHHPEKVLAVTKRFAEQRPQSLVPLITAVLRACQWCHRTENRHQLAEMLSRPEYLNQGASLLEESLSIGRDFGTSRQQKNVRPEGWNLRSFDPERTFPNKMHPVWMMRQMMRWGHLHPEADVVKIASQSCDTHPYRTAAAALDIPCPTEDFAPMELRRNQKLTLADVTTAPKSHHKVHERRAAEVPVRARLAQGSIR